MVNDKIKKALEQAVFDANQKPELASKLLSWMDNVVNGNENINDASRYSERCEISFNSVELGENNDDFE